MKHILLLAPIFLFSACTSFVQICTFESDNVKLMEDMLRTLSPETILTVAMDITGPEEYVASAAVKVWRSRKMPDINKRPAIFILGRA